MIKFFLTYAMEWTYRLRTWVLIILLLRFAFIFIYHTTGVVLPGSGTLDFDDYYMTAENVANGKGFVSPESNLYRRAYLGDNYYFASEPGYVLFLLIFLPNIIDHTLHCYCFKYFVIYFNYVVNMEKFCAFGYK